MNKRFKSLTNEFLNMDLSDKELNLFEEYKNLLQEWNKKIDITNIIEDEDVYIKHFIDSITIFKSGVIEDNMKIIDIGTGGGFPGIPMKVINESLRITLLDSLNKRIKFLDHVISTLDIKNMETIHGRAEEFSRDRAYRETYDIATSRAVANLSTLSEYALPFVKQGGYFISMKGPDPHQEIREAKQAIKILGGELEDVIEFNLPGDNSGRSLIIIKKIKNTNKKYPRGQGKPRKSPL